MPDKEVLIHPDQSLNPIHWTDDILIELTKHWEHPVTEDTPYDTKAVLRNEAWHHWMKSKENKRLNAYHAHIRKVRDSYERGLPIAVICRHAKISEQMLTRWVMKHKWQRPPEEPVKDDSDVEQITSELTETSNSITIVTPEEEADLPVEVREMNEQKRLLDLTPGMADQVPVKNWGKAMKLKIGKIAFSMLQELDALDGAELLDPETVKTVKSLSEIAKTFEAGQSKHAEESKPSGSSLNMYIMQGAPMPKKAKVRELKA